MRKARSLKNVFVPNKTNVIFTIIFSVLFWFFPIISTSIIAWPFYNLEMFYLSIILNVIIAYFFSCLIATNLNNRVKLVLTVLVIIIIYLLIPKIATYSIGDVGGAKDTYCKCYGIEKYTFSCCYSSVNYCIGICKRTEKTYFSDYFKG
jgi:hypothetical protein